MKKILYSILAIIALTSPCWGQYLTKGYISLIATSSGPGQSSTSVNSDLFDNLGVSITSAVPIITNITGNVTGDLTGNVTGNLTGNVAGNVTGNIVGNQSGGTAIVTGLYLTPGTVVTNTASTLTLTAANMAKNAIFQQTGTTAPTFTLDTGSNLAAAVPSLAVGNALFFVVSNASNQTITMAGGSGTTLANAMTVATLQSRTFWCIKTNTTTFTIY